MKKILALALCGLLCLSGCSSMLERSYVSAETHVDYFTTEDESILSVENYRGLVNCLSYLVTEHSEKGTVRLYNYTGDVEADLANACDEVLYEDPLGAYILRDIRYTSTRILTYYEVELTLTYTHTAEEAAAILEAIGQSGLQQTMAALVAGKDTSAAILTTYFSGDVQMVDHLLTLAWWNDPTAHYDPSGTFDRTIKIYPEEGPRRIIELGIKRSYLNREIYTRELDRTAKELLEQTPPAGETYTVRELALLLRSAAGPFDPHGGTTTLSGFSGNPVTESAVLLAMEYLCQQNGIYAGMVIGDQPNILWLIVETGEGYRHLLPADLFAPTPAAEDPAISDAPEVTDDPAASPQPDVSPAPDTPVVPLYTDEEMAAMGYSWPRALHPACTAEEVEDPGSEIF